MCPENARVIKISAATADSFMGPPMMMMMRSIFCRCITARIHAPTRRRPAGEYLYVCTHVYMESLQGSPGIAGFG